MKLIAANVMRSLPAAAYLVGAAAAHAQEGSADDCELVSAAMSQMVQANIANIEVTGNMLQNQAAMLAHLATSGDGDALAAAAAVTENLGQLQVPSGPAITDGMAALRRICPEG